MRGALGNGAGIVLKHLLSEVSFILVKRWVRPPSFYKGEMGMAHETCVLESGNALDPKQQSLPREWGVGAYQSTLVSDPGLLALQPGWVRGGYGIGTFGKTNDPRPRPGSSSLHPASLLPPEDPRASFCLLERKIGPGDGDATGHIQSRLTQSWPLWHRPGVPSYSGG